MDEALSGRSMREYRGTLILLGVAAVLAAAVYLLDARGSGETKTPDKGVAVFSLQEGDVAGLTVREGAKSATLAKDASGKWQVQSPGSGAADDWTAASLVSGLVKLRADRLVAEKADNLAAYGLESPSVEIALTLANGGEERLLVGAENPRGTGFYARKASGDAIYLLEPSPVTQARNLAAQPFAPTPTASPTASGS